MENKKPFFTVVIPTKNRPVLLKDAIKSVLMQNFNDFELIVSDNHNDESTQKVLNEFISNSQVKVIRPEKELSMINHWEFSTKHASGKYVIVLADRKVLYQNALKKIHKTIIKHPTINAFSVGVQTFNEITNRMGWCDAIGKTKKIKTKDLIDNFLNENIFGIKSFDTFFPKTLNGVYKNSYAIEIREKYGNYFNNLGVTTPDYSSFFINAALNDEIVYIGEKIILTQGESTSNGRNFGAGKFKAYMDSLNLEDPYQFVPIKAPLIYNLLFVDFFTIQKKIGGNLNSFSINWENFYTVNLFELFKKKDQGLDKDGYIHFNQAINNAIKQEININRDKIEKEAKAQFEHRNSPQKFDKIIRFKYHLNDFISARFSAESKVNKYFTFEFKNVLQAAGFNEI